MESKVEKIKPSRVKFTITATAVELQHAAEHAFAHVTSHVAVKGFRPGKAPRPLLVQKVGKGHLLSELVDHALPELLDEASRNASLYIIEHPSYTIETLCELQDDGTPKEGTQLIFTAEADYAPEVEVGDYTKLKVTPAKVAEVTEETVDDILEELRDRRGQFKKVERASKKGDRMEIDFAGKRNGIPEERLASKHYPLILGSGTMIPGFEDALMGKKAGETVTFEVTFPKDYHAKDLANEKIVFEVVVHEVAEKELAELNDTFAEAFGHKTLAELRDAIKQEREFVFAEEAKDKNQETVLEAFLPLVAVEVPKSLLERELDRQVDIMREQAAQYGLNFAHYLQHLKKTEEELREELRPTAEKAVRIGLGLGKVAEREGLTKDKDTGYAAIERLLEIALKEPSDSGDKETKSTRKTAKK